MKDKIKSMIDLIKTENDEISYDDMLIGIYLYCKDNYAGEHSDYYKIMCEIDFNYKGSDENLPKDFPDAFLTYDILMNNLHN
jgi:hypothetical protein